MAKQDTPISNVALSNTFAEWLASHNDIIDTIVNPITDSTDRLDAGHFELATVLNEFTVGTTSTSANGIIVEASDSSATHRMIRLRNVGSGSGWGAAIGFSIATTSEGHVDKAHMVFSRAGSGGRGTLAIAVDESSDGNHAASGDNVWSYSSVDKVHTWSVSGNDKMHLDDAGLHVTANLEVTGISFPDDTRMTTAPGSTARPTEEEVFDHAKNIIEGGTGVTVTDDDPNNTITIAVTRPTEEEVFDHAANIIVGGTGITANDNDSTNRITLSADPFDLHDDVGTALTSLANDDRFLVSDESTAGDPNRYITAANVKSFVGAGVDVSAALSTNPLENIAGGALIGSHGFSGTPDGVIHYLTYLGDANNSAGLFPPPSENSALGIGQWETSDRIFEDYLHQISGAGPTYGRPSINSWANTTHFGISFADDLDVPDVGVPFKLNGLRIIGGADTYPIGDMFAVTVYAYRFVR